MIIQNLSFGPDRAGKFIFFKRNVEQIAVDLRDIQAALSQIGSHCERMFRCIACLEAQCIRQ